MSNPEIRFVPNSNIDRSRWDQCISRSSFGIAYAYSWYLDRICREWDALIGGNYQYLMPLVNNRKYGIRYIYQPFFTQQLGIFSELPVNDAIVLKFLGAIPVRFRLTDMNLNLGNSIQSNQFSSRKNITYHLNLSPEITELRSGYNTNTRRNIQKAKHNNVSVMLFSDIRIFTEFTRINLKKKSPEIKVRHYYALAEVVKYALYHNLGEIYVARNAETKLLSAAFFLKTNQTCIYLAASSNQEGIEKKSMFLLLDTFIENNAGSRLTLDFEGSNIHGIARFYAGFGASPKNYYSIHQNRLPSLIRLLKK